MTIEQLEKEIALIKQRNAKVEEDKAWETSSVRKIIIAIVTYILISFYMAYLHIDKPLINALVPMIGYILSTLTMNWAKSIWQGLRKR